MGRHGCPCHSGVGMTVGSRMQSEGSNIDAGSRVGIQNGIGTVINQE